MKETAPPQEIQVDPTSAKPGPAVQEHDVAPTPPRHSRMAAAVVTLTVVAIVGLSLWYLVQPHPLLVQGEADATRIDIAARVDGRVGQRPISRGDDVSAGQILVAIDNPRPLTKLQEAEAVKGVALADLARIQVGTRAEVIAARKAAVAAGEASVKLAQQTYDRVQQLTQKDFASVQKLDEATASLDVAQRSVEQAKRAFEEAVAGYTAEERGVAQANVAKARTDARRMRGGQPYQTASRAAQEIVAIEPDSPKRQARG